MSTLDTVIPKYEDDRSAWAEKNAQLLRQGRISEIDTLHIAEELEDMGRSEKHALASHLKVLITHLLKWLYQPTFRGVSWQLSIDNSRDEIEQLLEDSPSLRTKLDQIIAARYRAARKRAAMETGLQLETFPESCPFDTARLLDESYWPE